VQHETTQWGAPNTNTTMVITMKKKQIKKNAIGCGTHFNEMARRHTSNDVHGNKCNPYPKEKQKNFIPSHFK
jgi:hypothetical protein